MKRVAACQKHAATTKSTGESEIPRNVSIGEVYEHGYRKSAILLLPDHIICLFKLIPYDKVEGYICNIP